jgi:5-enolpyruvylshikimate-3-phosphate synthase
LPSSKSIANRVLLIQKLCKESFKIKNLSTANDTDIFREALALNSESIDIQTQKVSTLVLNFSSFI